MIKDEANNADTEKQTSDQFINIPSVTLPKGGGALKNIDEKFQVNAANGSASFSVPLEFSKTRNNFTPSLSLNYNSGSGNSVFGLGWSISLSSIQRKTDKKLPEYKDALESDVFMFTGSEDLVPALQLENGNWTAVEFKAASGEKVKAYRPRIETEFNRVERITPANSSTFYWRVTSPDNIVTIYGRSASARIANPGDSNQIYKWLPEYSFDDKGNCFEIEYVQEDLKQVDPSLHEKNRLDHTALFTNSYLKRIKYGNKTPYYVDETAAYNPQAPVNPSYLFEAVFDYGDHDDANPSPLAVNSWLCRTEPFSEYKPGFEIRTYRLCRRILFFHYFKELNDGINPAPCLVRSLDLSYKLFNNALASADEIRNAEADFIISLQQSGYKKNAAGYSKKSVPPVEFTYQPLSWDTSVKDVSPENIVNAPEGISNKYLWIDLWSEGISGILTEQADAWYYKNNMGDGNFSVAKPVVPKPSFTGLSEGRLQLMDLEADGRKFIVSTSGDLKGYYELSQENEWLPFYPFNQNTTLDFSNPEVRLIDVNGDGKPDLIFSDENVFTWYASKGIAGYDSAEISGKYFDDEKGPALVFADESLTIFLADMSGDGMTDIVQIKNGEICYWPNLGYGSFGPKVNMDQAPFFDTEDQFNPAYIHLADISGTGATDILYLGKNECKAWINLSGNKWSESVAVDPFPTTEFPNRLSVVDFLGNGTACIVWSSPLAQNALTPMRYIDLMNGIKPFVITGYKNNFGKEVTWEYKSSTFFYLADKRAGIPWITKLPFPVQCVSKIATTDRTAGTYFSSEYIYHHGYFDYPEREYRGFGKVEQTDTEVFTSFKLSGAQNVTEEDLYQPPVKTITWFHTGVFFHKQNILQHYSDEYWYKVMSKEGFPVTVIEYNLNDAVVICAPGIPPNMIDTLTADEWREVSRACKGMMLRQEVYALDAPATGATPLQLQTQLSPYSVSEHNCFIELLQQRANNRYAVFTVKESEAITYNYERNTGDPRIAHTFNLTLDKFGNVLQSASVSYGRNVKDVSLPAEVSDEQSKMHILFTDNVFTNDFDVASTYRLPMPAETKTFELTGVTPASIFFKPNELQPSFAAAVTIEYQDTANNVSVQKRLIENKRTIYLNNDLVTPLPLLQLDTLAFQYQKFELAFTPALVSLLYGSRVTDAMLTDAKYVLMDSNWWVQSGTSVYFNGIETAVDAKKRFYIPIAVKDAYDMITSLTYDEYNLMLVETEDALHNKATVIDKDYRVLQATKLRDANNNYNEIITDELGMVIATSVYGDESDGLHGDNPLSAYSIIEPGNLAEVVTDPNKFLQGATTFFFYDLFAWSLRSQPACFATLVRETHESELEEAVSKVIVSVGYTSGLGKNLQTKVQAEPGLALKWDGNVLVSVDTTPLLRWVGTGRTILNNKGKTVKQYEPFFSTTYEYEDEKALTDIGFSSVLYYDSLGRNIRTEHPVGTLSKTEFDAWKQLVYDENDTVIASDWYADRGSPDPSSPEPSDAETRAAWLTAKHAETASQLHLDSLGRQMYAIADNGAGGKYATRTVLDIENNQLAVIDALGKTVMQYRYDMIGRKAYLQAMDSGERWSFNDIMNKPVYSWDSMKHQFHTEYDELHRPVKEWVIEDTSLSNTEKLVKLTIYGEGQPGDTAFNLRTKAYQSFDQSGLTQTVEYDFKGNVKNGFKRLASDYKLSIDWNIADPLTLLDAKSFQSSSLFDALNRAVTIQLPDDSIVTNTYNEAKLLKQVNMFVKSQNQTVPFVQNVNYNAKGQRESILYGNNTVSRYTYDEKNYRLTRLLTTRNLGADILQDLNYTYDPVGNVTQTDDNSQPTIFFNNAGVNPQNTFEYDAIYRLTRATGREHAGTNAASDQFDNDKTRNGGGLRLTLKGDMNAMQKYEQQYLYNEVGNMLQMIHNAGNGIFQNKWTRSFDYSTTNNQLTGTHVGADTTSYSYDAHGNMFNLQNGTYNLTWNYSDQLQKVDLGGGGTAYYVYDASGKRIRKVIENGNLLKERIYIGNYELYREIQNDNIQLERETLHVADDKNRIALIETRTQGEDAGLPFLIRYQYGNHLGTVSLEVNGDPLNPDIISYEEYYPFGSTAYQAMRNQTETAKRYRYTGKERDEESGLYYHGARYCASWLARWLSPDPSGIGDGLNVYVYVKNNPVRSNDVTGMQGDDQTVKITGAKATAPAPRFPLPGVPSAYDDGVPRALPPPGQGAEVTADIALPDVQLAGRTSFGIIIGRPLPGDASRRRLDITGDFHLQPQWSFLQSLPSFVPFHPSISGDISGSGSTLSSAVGSPLPDAQVAVTGFTGKLVLSGDLKGVPLVAGRFRLQEDIANGAPTALSFHARIGVFGTSPILPGVSFSGSGTATSESLHLSGKFAGYGPGVTWGNWSFDRKAGFQATGNYIGLQFGPLGLGSLDPRPAVPSPGDPPSAFTPPDVSGRLTRYGTVDTFGAGTGVGYTRFSVNPTTGNYLILSAGWAWKASITHNDMSRPDIMPFDIPVVGDALKSALKYDPSSKADTPAGNYFGASISGSF